MEYQAVKRRQPNFPIYVAAAVRGGRRILPRVPRGNIIIFLQINGRRGPPGLVWFDPRPAAMVYADFFVFLLFFSLFSLRSCFGSCLRIFGS